jgi:hypothetical protein
MSVVFSGTNQGRFTSTGAAQIIQLRSDVDWMWVINETVSYAAGGGTGSEFYWQRGMAQGRGLEYIKTAATNALAPAQIAATAGFYLIDTSVNIPGASRAITSITGNGGTLANPLVLTGDTGGMAVVAADTQVAVVRVFNTAGALQLGGMDFAVSRVVNNVSFDLLNMPAIVNAAGPGTYRIIPFDPMYYPRNRYITKISQAAQALVTLSVQHGFTVGQVVRFIIPTVTATTYGMTELNGLTGTVVATGTADILGATNTITVDINTTAFGAFAIPLTASAYHTFAQVVPVGENTASALTLGANILGDATLNTGYIGIQLQAGVNSPAGVANDVIYWVAGKSFSVDN